MFTTKSCRTGAFRHIQGYSDLGTPDGPYSHSYRQYDRWGNLTERLGWGGENPQYSASYTNNRRDGSTYDAAGNVTNNGEQSYQYDADGRQAWASINDTRQSYDGDRLRGKRVENGAATYHLRSSVLGGKVIAELDGAGNWQRGYVYLGSQLLALQQGGVEWVHQDPIVKSQRLTNAAGGVTAGVELDPWGGDTYPWGGGTRGSFSQGRQPQRYTSYLIAVCI